ncbi:MAG: septum formation protein Maf [Candidatus Heimdallarchaeota archaeon]|nr:septum formation protein Maf [Candidatus Heimdallarchaeota archaeon]MBY8994931.1 septum formation protein Maf [Candidatus Heimdallarchaeota archaeon]
MKKVILASASPRRHELLKLLGIEHEVIPCNEDEKQLRVVEKFKTQLKEKITSKTIEQMVLEVAYQKASCVVKSLPANKKMNSLVIGADTIVVLNNEIIGKPKSKKDAISMLQKLLGNIHEVFTGICILDLKSDKILSAVEKTLVSMIEWPIERIEAYVDAEHILDKAGGYAIQGIGAAMIDKVDGCFYNVMGLPLSRLVSMLDNLDYNYL